MVRFAFLLLVLGCSSPAPAPSICANDPRVETFTPGLTSKGLAGAAFTILSATPSVVQQGLNDWNVRVRDSVGAPIVGTLSITSVMPDHGHGSPTFATITPNGDGTYAISGINLSMRGVWQVTLTVTSPQMNDSASFDFCIDGT